MNKDRLFGRYWLVRDEQRPVGWLIDWLEMIGCGDSVKICWLVGRLQILVSCRLLGLNFWIVGL